MKLTKQNKFILAIALQILIIAGIIVFKFSVLTGGANVFLEIMPVDPRDPFRGDYITFQYAISNINSNQFTYTPKNGDTVYIPLKKREKYWTSAYGITKEKPNNNILYIKAIIINGGLEKSFPAAKNSINLRGNNSKIMVKYGIEEYFIPEGAGRNVDFRNSNAYAKVAIDDNGNAVLKQIFIEDKPWP